MSIIEAQTLYTTCMDYRAKMTCNSLKNVSSQKTTTLQERPTGRVRFDYTFGRDDAVSDTHNSLFINCKWI